MISYALGVVSGIVFSLMYIRLAQMDKADREKYNR